MSGSDGMAGSPTDGTDRYFGVVVGIVTNVNDPDHIGQVEIKLPWYRDGYRKWARVAQFYAGKGFGSTWVPEKHGEVLVAFDRGYLRSPYVIGCLHGKVDTPPHSRTASSDIRTLRTPAGSELRFDETKGVITLKTPKGTSVELAEKSGEITIKANSKISLDADEVSIHGKKKVSISGDRIDLN
jgi:uncharacterized protein involved in type VI secretion and phage assembly